jgi:hypothetical protein
MAGISYDLKLLDSLQNSVKTGYKKTSRLISNVLTGYLGKLDSDRLF